MTTEPELAIPHYECVTQATEQVISMTCGAQITSLSPEPAADSGATIIALISIVGDVDWAVFIGLPESAATTVAEKFAGFEIPFDSPDMGDAIGELTNIFAGQVKALLDAKGVTADISLPSVMRAKGIQMLVQKGGMCSRACYESELGRFWTGVIAQKPSA
ncbi:MAG: chemotaxis protein CheX [Phycisphaerae bacterium]